jgi:hypothetical protein
MDVRRAAGLIVAVPSLLVAMALPGNAATTGVVTFAGTVTITPTMSPGTGSLDACFFGVETCLNDKPSKGVAAGADVAQAVDGLQAHAEYTEVCAAVTGFPATGSATLTASVHQVPSSAWSAPVTATWQRVGLVAVIQGGATGAALFAPVAPAPAACGQPVEVAVIGAAEFTA